MEAKEGTTVIQWSGSRSNLSTQAILERTRNWRNKISRRVELRWEPENEGLVENLCVKLRLDPQVVFTLHTEARPSLLCLP